MDPRFIQYPNQRAVVAEAVAAAREAGDTVRAGYVVTTTAYEVLVGLWAINQRPLPPSGGIPSHQGDLNKRPTHLPDWFDHLMGGTSEQRIVTFEALCLWLVPQLLATP